MMRRHLILTLAAGGLLAGCGLLDSASDALDFDIDVDFDVDIPDPGDLVLGPDGRPITGESIGGDCNRDSDCRLGLACGDAGACAPTASTPEGELCTTTGECSEGLVCGLNAMCTPSAGVEEGGTCTAPTDCEAGLRCNLLGFTGICEPEGSMDIGGTCTTDADCLAPLGCGEGPEGGQCRIPVFGGVRFMPDTECVASDDLGDFRVLFEVPRDENGLSEFYRLPFPNDARVINGNVVLADHFNPGIEYVGGGFVDLYLDAISRTFDGFSINPTIFFRFSQSLDFGTLRADGDNPTLRFVNIDPDSPNYGNNVSMYWTITTGRGKFICQNYLAVHPSWSSPLEHGTTYAVYLNDGIRGPEGAQPVQDADLRALLSDSAPTDESLQEAWNSYQLFRDFLAEEGQPAATISGAAVFTTGDPDADMPNLRNAVREQPAPELSQLANCNAGDVSPCAEGADRACLTANGDFVQLHATYDAPIFQAGTRPYLVESDGGNVVFTGDSAEVQGTESICMSMTIPLGVMPEAGWPVSMYAHGTGGSFLSHISDGTAGRLAAISTESGTVNVASVSIDGVSHGPRRGDSDLDPENLFYNFINPNAARGNIQQGAADYFYLTYLLENIDIPASESPTGEPIRFDAANMYFFGHSQGAQVGAPFAAYEDNLAATIFSGAGGSLSLSLTNKTSPVDIAGAVDFVLTGRPDGQVNELDPLLSLLQWYIDPVDSLAYSRLYFQNVPEGETGIHVFQSFGFGDTYSPEANQRAIAGAMGVRYAGTEIPGVGESEYPVSGNRVANGEPVTGVVIAAEPTDFDGHFVIFRNADLASQSMEFIGSMILDGIPTVSER